MKEVISSSAEAKLGALFHNTKEACPLQTALEELEHLQSPTVVTTQQPLALPTTQSNNNNQKQLTCVSIGEACGIWMLLKQ
jgi:hypothetical protein